MAEKSQPPLSTLSVFSQEDLRILHAEKDIRILKVFVITTTLVFAVIGIIWILFSNACLYYLTVVLAWLGNPKAQYNMGMYYDAEKVDSPVAMEYYRKACDGGEFRGCYNVANSWFMGSMSLAYMTNEEARELLEKAAGAGIKAAEKLLIEQNEFHRR